MSYNCDNMIEDVLKTLDFKEEEARVYLALLDTGSSSAGDLAKTIGLARPTLYGYLDRLVKGGLVTQSLRHNVKIFTPEPGDKIRGLYKRKIDALKKQEQSLDDLIPQLEKRSGLSLARPRIQFFEGRAGLETAFQDPMKHPGALIKSFWSIKAAIEATSEDFFWYLNKERIKNDIYLKAIWPPSQVVDVKQNPFMGVGPEFKREIRVAPTEADASTGYWIYANKVLLASPRSERFCYIIESPDLYEMMSNQHKIIWDLSTPINPPAADMQPFLDDLYSD